MLSLRHFFILITLLIFQRAGATEFFEPFESIRQLGMGGVYVFDENDAGGFIQNPAYTCYAKGMNWTVFNVGIGIGDLQSILDLNGGSYTSVNIPTPSGFADLTPYFGKNIWASAGGYSSLMLPCFGAAASGKGLATFYLHNPAYPTLRTNYLTEYGVRVGGAIPLSPILSLGLDVKRMDRLGGPAAFGPDDLASMASGSNGIQTMATSVQNEGVGYGLDAGLVSRLSTLPLNPTLSLSWRDVGSTSYLLSKGTTAPERQKDNLVLGMTVDGSLPLIGLAAGIEYRHITDVGEQIGKKVHMGAELSLAFLDARAGFSQGYTTYGVGVDLWLIQLDAAWYKVEKGVYPGQTPDERVQVGVQMNLEFDPNFNFIDAGGKKRRLKQRR